MPEEIYDLESVQLPYLAGGTLKAFVNLLESPLGKPVIAKLLTDAGVTHFRNSHFNHPPTLKPKYHTNHLAKESAAVPAEELPTESPIDRLGFQYPTSFDYAQGYREGRFSPTQIASSVIEAIQASEKNNPPLRAILHAYGDDLLAQAEASEKRIQDGNPLSLLDGVPVAVKDELDMTPYPTAVGTSFLGKHPAEQDSTSAARLRASGALLIGKANMTEIGIVVTGSNPHNGPTRNPYNTAHYSGGSSSGPGAAVAAGLCPIAVGADGGGSIRIPSSFCGTFGIKSTFGRVSEHGAAPLCWSVAHNGPLAATAADLALAWGILAGPDIHDPDTLHQPLPTLKDWSNIDLKGLKLGIFWPWFEHAAPDIVEACKAMLQNFEQAGASVHEIQIPQLNAGRLAHVITISSEMFQAHDQYHHEHQKDYSLEVRINMALARTFTSLDYIKAQRVRTMQTEYFMQTLSEVDLILTPSTGITAPLIKPAAIPDGESDLTTLTEIMRFATPGNLTGLPAISFPVGYDSSGLPIGMQAMARPWHELTLLRLALAAEKHLERQKPQLFYHLI